MYARSRQRFSNSDAWVKVVAVAIIVAVALLIFGGVWLFTSGTRSSAICTVDDKDHTVQISTDSHGNSSNYDKFTVYTDCGNFTVDANPIAGSWSASTLYGTIRIGHRYKFDTVGWRVDWLSIFPNIVKAVEVKK